MLLFFTQVNSAVAQIPDEFAVNPFCEATRTAVSKSDYKEASQLIKQCVESFSKTESTEYAENLLLGAEIEYYLENDSDAANYAALAEIHFSSLTSLDQEGLWLFSIKLKKLRAALEVEAGNYQSALEIYRKGLSILAKPKKLVRSDGGEPHRLKADLLSGVSFIQLKTGLYFDAVKNLEAALELLDNSPLDNYSRPFILNDFGHLLNEQRSHQKAVGYLEKAAQIWHEQKDWRNFAMAQQNLAVAFRGTSDYKKAEIYFERVRDLAVKNNFGDLETMSLQGLASIYQIRNEHKKAVEILQKALGQTSASVRRAEILWRLSASQNQTGENSTARVGAAECFERATAQKIENLQYLCATSLGESYLPDSSAEAEKWFQAAVDVTENLSRRVSGNEYGKVFFMQDKEVAYHKLINLLVEKKQISEAFFIGEKLKSRVLREKSQNRKSSILNENETNIPNFPADTTAVSFVATADECYVFAVKAGKIIKTAKLPIGENELRKKIKQYRESIVSFNPKFKAEGKQLYELLFGEFEKEINGSKRLIIVPDGALWELPFQALIDATSGKYLVEEHEIFLYAFT